MPRGKLALVLVSTIIPAFNSERTIAQTIESALAQRYDSHEIVIVNDGSTDATARILERYRDRLRIVNQNNRGAAAARNAGIAYSNGEYLAFLDSDDLFLPSKLAVMTAALRQNPAASLAFSEYGFIDESGTEYRESAIGEWVVDGGAHEENVRFRLLLFPHLFIRRHGWYHGRFLRVPEASMKRSKGQGTRIHGFYCYYASLATSSMCPRS